MVNQAKSLATEGGLSSDIPKDTTKNGVVAAKNDDACFIKSTRTSMLVKVTMDGVLIGRKVDLNGLDSYEALAKTLKQMFFQIPSSVTSQLLVLFHEIPCDSAFQILCFLKLLVLIDQFFRIKHTRMQDNEGNTCL